MRDMEITSQKPACVRIIEGMRGRKKKKKDTSNYVSAVILVCIINLSLGG